MKRTPLILLSALLLGSLPSAYASNIVSYAPAVVLLSGKVTEGEADHPSGTVNTFHLLHLDAPITVLPNKDDDNVAREEDVRVDDVDEIQVMGDAKMEAAIKALADTGGTVVLKGTLFHAYTGWHVRDIVMAVDEIVQKRAPRAAQ